LKKKRAWPVRSRTMHDQDGIPGDGDLGQCSDGVWWLDGHLHRNLGLRLVPEARTKQANHRGRDGGKKREKQQVREPTWIYKVAEQHRATGTGNARDRRTQKKQGEGTESYPTSSKSSNLKSSMLCRCRMPDRKPPRKQKR